MRPDAGTRILGGGLGDHRRTAERLREASRYDQAAVEFQAAKDYAAAAHCFETAGDFEQAAVNYLRAGDHAQAGNAYRQAGNPVRAARMYERAGNFAFAAGLFREAGEFGNAARCFQRLGEASSAGEMFERAGQTLMAGESFFEAGMFGRAARLFEDASAWSRAVDAWTAAGDRSRAAAARRRMGARPGGPGPTPAHGTPAGGVAARDRDATLRDPDALGALFARLAKQGFLTAADERIIERFERTPITRESLPAFLDLVRLYRVVALDDRCRRLCNLIREEAVGVPDLAAALAAASSADAELPSGARRASPPPFERDASDAWERTGTPSFASRTTPAYGTPARGTPSFGTRSSAAAVSFDAAPLNVSEIGEGDLFDGRYRIVRKLGAGTIGAVFMAFDERLDEHVALKVLKPMSNVGEDVVSRFKQEIKITRKIVHPGVVRTFDFGEYGGLPYLSMEYVDGRDLRHSLREVGHFGLLDGVRIVRAICGALEAAHRLDVIHRDIKPENILLDARGEVKLIDFGIAKIRDAVTAALTETSIGTPEYVSPEMAMGQPVDRRTDIYSVGAVMYEIFCGVPPFRGGGLVSILRRHVAERPKPPRALVPEIPPALEATILRALAKDPAQRHDTVSELEQELALVCL